MAINPETLDAQRKLAESRFGEFLSYNDVLFPSRLLSLADELIMRNGRVLESDGKKIKQADFFAYDSEEHVRYIWKLTNNDIAVHDGLLVSSTGDLSRGLTLEGFSLIEIATDSARGIVPSKLKAIELPRSIMHRDKLMELSVEHSNASLDKTTQLLRSAHEIGTHLFDLASGSTMFYLQQIDLLGRQL